MPAVETKIYGTSTGGGPSGVQASHAGGATMGTEYYHRTTGVVPVAIDDLKDFKSSSVEEFLQFSLGGFFASGSFWLLVERFFTVPRWSADLLFWICVVAFAAGLTIGWFGFRQMKRRKTKIDEIILSAERVSGVGAASNLSAMSSGSLSQTSPAIPTQPKTRHG
jgi:hypothetical protein